MIPTQVGKIWLGAVAFLIVWGLLALQVISRQSAVRSVEASYTSTRAAQSRLERSLRLLSDMESSNRSYLISPLSREPFENAKDAFSLEYNKVKAFYGIKSAASTQMERDFKGPFKKWLALYSPIIQQRRQAGNTQNPVLNEKITGGEQERAQVLGQARAVLERYRKAFTRSASNLEQQQHAREAAVATFTHVRTVLGFLGIVGLALAMARLAGKLSSSNESLRREIEGRRRVERERQVLADHDEQILNSTTEGIVGLNIKGRITFVNPAAAGMLGWEVQELLGKSWHDIAQHSRGDNTRLDKDASPIMATLRDTSPRRITDDVFWKRTGRTFPVEYAISPLFELAAHEPSGNGSDEKHLSGATLTFRDITERKRSEIALLRLASVVESSKDAILSHLLDGTIVSCNASAVKMYGYSPREIEGQPLSVLYPPTRADEVMLVADRIARGERIEPYQTTLLTKSGAAVDVAITYYPVRDARGNIMGASSNARPMRRDARGTLPTFEALRAAAPRTEAASAR